MKINMPTTKMVYYYQHVNQYGHLETKARVEVLGLGITVTSAFEEWKHFMAAVGYFGMEKYELTETEDDNT